jgi:transketolase
MRGTFVKTLMGLMERDKKIMLVTADMGFGTFEELQAKFPDRIVNTGVSEADAASISAALSMNGFTVFFYAQAAFVTLRCFEQVRLDIASNNANVKLVGTSSGFTLSQYGASHFAVEDVAAMRALPNMTIFCPGDLYEAEEVTKLAVSFQGPAYIRIGRTTSGADQAIHPRKPTLRIGEPIVITKGSDATIVSTGSMLAMAAAAAAELGRSGIRASLVSLPTVKPLNAKKVLDLFKKNKTLYVLEEHSRIGGLGTAIAEIVADSGKPYRVARLGTEDKFLHVTGTRDYLLGLHGLTPGKIAARIKREVRRTS